MSEESTELNRNNIEIINIEDISFKVDKTNGIIYKTKEKAFYIMKWSSKYGQILTLYSFYCNIKIKRIVKYYDDLLFEYSLNEENYMEKFQDIFTRVKKETHITGEKCEYFTLFLTKFIEYYKENNKIEEIHDILYIDSNKYIQVEFKELEWIKINLIDQLNILNLIYRINTNQQDFIRGFCYHSLDLVSFELRRLGKIFPFKMNFGIMQSGKSYNEKLWILKGYNQVVEHGLITPNECNSLFMLSKKASADRLPKLCDDFPIEFFIKFNTYLKSAVSSNNFGERGTQGLDTKKYPFSCNLTFTLNQQMGLEKATSFRSIQSEYTLINKDKQNSKIWFEEYNKLIDGFMFKLVYELFNNYPLMNLINSLENITNSETEYNQTLLNFVYNLLKQFYINNGVEFIFEPIKLETNDDFDQERIFVESLKNEWNHIEEAEKSINYTEYELDNNGFEKAHRVINSKYFYRPILSKEDLKVEGNKIYLTRNGFKIWKDKYKPANWNSIKDYVNDSRMDPKPKISSGDFNGHKHNCLIIDGNLPDEKISMSDTKVIQK